MAPFLQTLAILSFSFANALDIRLGVSKTPGALLKEAEQQKLTKRDVDPELLYPAYNLSVPVDHFHNDTKYEPHSDDYYDLRYWFDASHYKPGGPVIVLQSGETDGTGRLPYLQKGIVAQLAQVTNGIGVILEHRYYGTSMPTPDFSTENLRFLTTAQAMADEAYFARNIEFPGLEKYGDLTSKTTAYISYGGSYAGAFSAFLRVQYPDVFWGSISSSGVTKAIWDYWAYFQPIAEKAPQDCVASQRLLIAALDNIWINHNNTGLPQQLKDTFGLSGVTYDTDFASLLSNGIYNWQSLNWDPEVGSDEFYYYCDNITSTTVEYNTTESKRANVTQLLTASGTKADTAFVNQLLNMIGYFNLNYIAPCADGGSTQDQCFSTHNQTYYSLDGLDTGSWRSWPYQYCTEWGYLQTGDTPADELPLISRTVDLEYSSIVCRDAFNISEPADVDAVNKYGGYDISYPRLAIIDGDWDPWKEATPHAFDFGAKSRQSTFSEPFILIPESVHHWDENGLFPNETTANLPPQRIKTVQSQEAQFVLEWMQEWKQQKYGGGWPHGGGWGHGGPGWGHGGSWP